MYDGCLNVDAWMSANRYFAKSLSDTPIRFCSRFFVSENFSPCSDCKQPCLQRYHNAKNVPA